MANDSGVARELLAIFGFGVDTKELEKGESQLDKFLGKVQRVAEGIAAAFAIKEIYEFADAQAELLDRLDDTANALGITTDRVQEFQFASRAMGDDADRLLHLMGRMQVMQQEAIQGSQEQTKAFAALHITTAQLKNEYKNADDLFLAVADGIKNQTDASVQAAIATKIFGREGRALLPFLKEGSEGFADLVAQYRELGGGYTQQAIEAGARFQIQQARLNLVMTSFKNVVLVKLLPLLSKLVGYLTQAAKWLKETAENSHILEVAFGALTAAATAFAISMAIANAPILLITAAIAALILIIEDFVGMLTGDESVIGDVIDRIFGKDAHVEVVKDIKAAWEGVTAAFREMWPWVEKTWGFFKFIVERWGDIGDKLAQFSNWTAGIREKEYSFARKVVGGAIGSEATEASVTKQAQAKVNAAAIGKPWEGVTEVPAGVSREEMYALIQARARELRPTNTLPRVGPGIPDTFGPSAPAPFDFAAQGADVGGPLVTMTVQAAPGMDEEKLGRIAGERAGQAVHKVLKERNRAALATRQRKAVEQ
jgi:hypothetical protein